MRTEIDACNYEGGLHIQLVTDEPKAFDGFLAHYGKFSGVRNYIALIGKKDVSEVAKAEGQMPDWFKNGVEAVLLAPTAMNQQKFVFALDGTKVTAKAKKGFYTKLDLGIVKYHFEIGAGQDKFQWGLQKAAVWGEPGVRRDAYFGVKNC